MPGMRDTFELRRQTDGLVHRFDRQLCGRYRRQDGPYWIVRHPVYGWVAQNEGSDEVFGRHWTVPPEDQGGAPPEGVWVSRKGAKAYVYDLVYL